MIGQHYGAFTGLIDPIRNWKRALNCRQPLLSRFKYLGDVKFHH
jgi:hypothetical protein